MSRNPNFTITLTINPEDSSLTVQATCENISKKEILMSLDKLREKIQTNEFETYEESASFYSDGTLSLLEPSGEPNISDLISPEDEQALFEEMDKAEAEYHQKWESAKKELEGLIDPKYFTFAEDNDNFYSDGIVEIIETDARTSGYSDFRHCKEKDGDGRLYVYNTDSIESMDEDSEDEAAKVEYWVWQVTGYLGDDYSGFLLLPLLDGRYWKVGYSC